MAEHIFKFYIRTPQKRLWEALTNPEDTVEYYFDTKLRSELYEGSMFQYVHPEDQELAIDGEILELDEPDRLIHSFDFPHTDDQASRVTFELVRVGEELTELTVTHDELIEESETFYSTKHGWPRLLSSLKSYLETGEALAFPEE